MFRVPDETVHRFDVAMETAGVAMRERWHYHKWLRYYLDFCRKYRYRSDEAGSLAPFIEKLGVKNQSDSQCQQASRAVRLYLGTQSKPGLPARSEDEKPLAAREGRLTEPSSAVGADFGADRRGKLSNAPKPSRREAQPTGSPSVAGGSSDDALPATGASCTRFRGSESGEGGGERSGNPQAGNSAYISTHVCQSYMPTKRGD